MTRPGSTIAVAGLSARLMAETAANDGFNVVALDIFGDADTRRAARCWAAIGAPGGGMQIDPALLLAALARLAAQGDVAGWVAGSGFDGRHDLLEQGAKLLPLIGTAPAAVARLRDPAQFFAFLATHEIAHPPVRLSTAAGESDDDANTNGNGGGIWLHKDAGGSGGWHIGIREPGARQPLPAGHYLQRQMAGQSMSATFVADGSAVQLFGINQQTVRAVQHRPHVYCGVIGPVPVAAAVQQQVQRALQALTAEFALCGLGSLDFLLDAGRISVLEVNARPPASMALYAHRRPMAAHLRACGHGAPATAATAPQQAGPLRGDETLFARRPLWLDSARAAWLAAQPATHDLPCAGQRFARGDPVCSIHACGDTAAGVLQQLQTRREVLLTTLETLP